MLGRFLIERVMHTFSCGPRALAGLNKRRLFVWFFAALFSLASACKQQRFDGAHGIVLHGTIVTMDAAGTIIPNGNVLVRNNKIVAVWSGHRPPTEVPVGNAVEIDVGSGALIFPGLINLHDHPGLDALALWPAPSSHVQEDRGRPNGTEPYANRYQWNGMKGFRYATPPQEHHTFIKIPYDTLNKDNLGPEVGKYAQVKAILGGETTSEGGQDHKADNILIRNVEYTNFGHGRIERRVQPIGHVKPTCLPCPSPTPDPDCLDCLITPMQSGQVDAWIVHLAEGVRDSQRRDKDTLSSREEFQILKNLGLLTDTTVIIHGIALEPEDFVAMHDAPSIRWNAVGDGLGAKLVWSPLSNLLLYGQTALVYQALQAGVVVSLGTDWSPSGSRNLLDELKIADITLRDPRLLGADRDLVPSLSVARKSGHARREAEIALDKLLVEMVTTNPAKTLRWTQDVGSIEPGKFADLVLVTKHSRPSAEGLPDSPYRNLIDATEQDVRLVLVNGEPLCGDVAIMEKLKPGDYEVIPSVAGCFSKAIDVTIDLPKLKANKAKFAIATEKFESVQKKLSDALTTMGIQLLPVFVEDDHFYFHLLGGEVSANTGLIADDKPPFGLYPANFNQIQPLGNPFVAQLYRDRYFQFCPGIYKRTPVEALYSPVVDEPDY